MSEEEVTLEINKFSGCLGWDKVETANFRPLSSRLKFHDKVIALSADCYLNCFTVIARILSVPLLGRSFFIINDNGFLKEPSHGIYCLEIAFLIVPKQGYSCMS